MTPPRFPQTGPRNDITDITSLRAGSAHDKGTRTGVTVILPDEPAICAVDVRGGGPGTRETDLLAPSALVDKIDAIVLSGGSSYGLAAADGVAAWLGAQGRGYRLAPSTAAPPSPIVPAAILYDLANGGDKAWGQEPPYRRLGVAAAQEAHESGGPMTLGRAGVGFGATAGDGPGGLGAASIVLNEDLTIAAVAAVNSFGSVRMPGADAFWAWPFERDGEFGGARPPADWRLPDDPWAGTKLAAAAPRANTTIACVAVSAALTVAQAKRIAIMAQDGLARAIRPVHAPTDGDIVFAIAMGEAACDNPLTLTQIGAAAADCLARAVARGVFETQQQE